MDIFSQHSTKSLTRIQNVLLRNRTPIPEHCNLDPKNLNPKPVTLIHRPSSLNLDPFAPDP
jgi:hypothetical protein